MLTKIRGDSSRHPLPYRSTSGEDRVGGKGRRTIRQFITFAAVGSVGTIIQYATMIAFVQFLALRPFIGSATGFVLGAFVNYHLNYRITFHSTRRHRKALPRFYVVAFIGLGLNILSMYILNERLAIHYLIAQMITTGLVVFSNFAGNKFWTFRKPSRITDRPTGRGKKGHS